MTRIRSYSEAGEELGVLRQTVADLMRSLGRPPKVVRHNGRAKGCDESDMLALKCALTPGQCPHSAVSA